MQSLQVQTSQIWLKTIMASSTLLALSSSKSSGCIKHCALVDLYQSTARPRDMRLLDVQTLKIYSLKLG